MGRCHNPHLARLLADQRGATAAEFGLVALLFSGMILGTISFGRIIFEIGAAKAGLREAARIAATSPLVSTWLQNIDASTDLSLASGNGEPIPVNKIPLVTCTAPATGAPSCAATSTGSSIAMTSTAANAAVFDAIVAAGRRFNKAIKRENVVITYRHVGNGLAGNPYGPDIEPQITISLRNRSIATQSLSLFGLSQLAMPALTTSTMAEDMQ